MCATTRRRGGSAMGERGGRIARLPGMANAHSHAFQLDLRGVGERVTRGAGDDFWSWRSEMYRLAGMHDPESMREVGSRVYGMMARAGYGAVGEFHYVHHRPDGTPYEDPNAMATALAEAALDAGLEITLLPAAYQRGGWAHGSDIPPSEGQRRFCDPSVQAYLERVDALRDWASGPDGRGRVTVGVAAHSVRAVPAAWLEAIAGYAERHGLVRHIHAAEQRRELAECEAEHGCSPIELLHRTGFLGPRTSVVHAIHVSDADIARLAHSEAIVVTCPTTEGNLGDGVLPGLRYRDAGVRLAIGTDEQVRIDPFEELREMETLARREGQTRDALLAAADGDLWGATVAAGRASLGLDEADRRGGPPEIEIDLGHPEFGGAGAEPENLGWALATCVTAAVVRAGVGARRGPAA
jgi:formimidoylglutamate deiminase